MQFSHVLLENLDGGTIEADDGCIFYASGGIQNDSGAIIEAKDYGIITFEGVGLVNQPGALVQADDAPTGIDNQGDILATHHGTVEIAYSLIDNQGGTIAADGECSVVQLYDDAIFGGRLDTADGGTIEIVSLEEHSANTTVFDGSLDGPLTNDAYVNVDAGANLELIGTIHNLGTINVDCEETTTDLVISGPVTLDSGGTITLDGLADQIVGASDSELVNKLDNVDNTIQGAGNIGDGDHNLSVTNGSGGLIDANVTGHTLTINTGNVFENDGTLGADGGRLVVDDNVCGSGSVFITDGGTADFVGTFDQPVTFEDASTLGLNNSYSGTITGYAAGDIIDLADFKYSSTETTSWNSATGVLTLSNGSQTETLKFAGETFNQDQFALGRTEMAPPWC
jgi:hypothetical protein